MAKRKIHKTQKRIDSKYDDAIKDFVGRTIDNPEFFNMTPETQYKFSMNVLQEHLKADDEKEKQI
ncbi:MAG: hypothetical protein K0R54_147 [Clostridiaceae bacterium]|jgi:hypothetical protein|nr:hypothetical protein [Clostridiaceae bacterium]